MRTASDFVPDATSGNDSAIDIAAPPDVVWRVLEELRVDELWATKLLMGVRSLPARVLHRGSLRPRRAGARPTLVGTMTSSRFTVLCREPGTILTLGIVGQFWRLDGGDDANVGDAAAFIDFAQPGFVKSAIDFVLEGREDETRLTTRTCNRPTDDAAARRFRRYWRVIGPGSKLIRLDLLRAVRRRAETIPDGTRGEPH